MSEEYADESTTGAFRAQLRGARGAAQRMMEQIREQRAEIEQLRGLAGRYQREGKRISAEAIKAALDLMAQRDRAEARLRDIALMASKWPPQMRGAMMQAIDYELCAECDGDGEVPEYGPCLILCQHCDGVGWRPRGEDDE